LDMALPEKFELEYTAQDGSRQRPVMIHRAIFGSIERFFGILIENFAGRFPLWISPLQVRIVAVADRHEPYAQELRNKFVQAGFQCDVDASQESVSKKIRLAQLNQVNYMLTVGDQEMDRRTVNLRTRDNAVIGEVDVDEFIKTIEQEKNQRALQSSYFKK
jgi:threonyl-tRNA synthetase